MIFGTLGLILLVGVVLMLGLAGLSYGVQWLWNLVPFGVAGFLFGLIIIAITFFFSRKVFPERRFRFTFDYLGKLHFLEIIAYLYGFIIISASILWFFLPPAFIQTFPPFGDVFSFSIFAVFFLYGVGGCLTTSVLALRFYILGSVFYGACVIFGLLVINLPIWNFTERLPKDYYFLGKILFAFIFFLQILYLSFLHLFPAFRQYKKEKIAEAKKKKTNS